MIGPILISIFLLSAYANYSQTTLDWLALMDITLEKQINSEFGTSYDKATFGDWVQRLDSQEVFITGYMIPLDAMGFSYALSRNPNASCFFCGNAGPETVIQLWFSKEGIRRYKTDEYLKFKGKLKLNKTNDMGFIYELLEATPL